jgi:hypothetical protein
MPVERAEKFFRGDEGYNCAQAVFKAFAESHNLDDDFIQSHSRSGGGRALNGLCGALFAALELAETDEKKAEIKSKFEESAGATKCREVRRSRLLPCKECVKLAAKLVDESLG